MTVDLATVTRNMFDALVGERFIMRIAQDRTLDVELLATEPLPTAPRAVRDAFLLRFRSSTQELFPQQIYALEHATLGTLELFLVPSGKDAIGIRYDAVFS